MYIANCDTGSTLRKAVSHIFGRNKMCTRRMPENVWVYYCRKHYQRARYRNSHEWARTLQYDLVSRQVKRLEEWSAENRRTGDGGTVKDYQLSVRKREQKRLEAQKSKMDDEDSGSDDEEDATSATAVPGWLLDLCGITYNATDMLEIIDRIRVDLANGDLSAWPDIEIHPNIVDSQKATAAPRTYTRRKKSPLTQRRSQSLSGKSRAGVSPTDQKISRPTAGPSDRDTLSGGPSQKRRRYDEGDENSDVYIPPKDRRMRGSQSGMTPGLSSQHSSYQSILNNPDRDEYLHRTGAFGSYSGLAPNPSYTHSPASAGSRHNALSAAVYHDSGVSSADESHHEASRSHHERSNSDIGSMYSFQSSAYASPQFTNQPSPQGHDVSAPYYYAAPPRGYPSPGGNEGEQRPVSAHARHRSAPSFQNPFGPRDASPLSYQQAPWTLSPPPSRRGLERLAEATVLYSVRH
jgi:hypothetical protein